MTEETRKTRSGAQEIARLLQTNEMKALGAVSGQHGYHGCHRASIQLFAPGAPGEFSKCVADLDYQCEGWGSGRLVVS